MQIKYRVWDQVQRKFLDPYDEVLEPFGCLDFPSMDGRLIWQQWSGYEDQSGDDVFEGDVIEFEYFVGDFAWEQMDEEEREAQREMIGKKYEAVVERGAGGDVNMHVRVGAKTSTHMSFPLGYAGSKSKIISHIYA
jgi:hypothetical protein